MKFKEPRQEAEWELLHPQVQGLVVGLGGWSKAQDYPEPVITCLLRTRDENAALYGGDRKRFSWHLCFCAVDLRDNHYTKPQLAAVMRWLRDGRTQPLWEILGPHDVGAGSHLHVARRAHDWRNLHTPKE